MKVNQMAVALSGNSAAVLEWSSEDPGARLTLLESGERVTNEAMTISASGEWGIPGPRNLTSAVLELLTPSLNSTRTADELWVAARFGLVEWYPAVSLPGRARLEVETAMESAVWV